MIRILVRLARALMAVSTLCILPTMHAGPADSVGSEEAPRQTTATYLGLAVSSRRSASAALTDGAAAMGLVVSRVSPDGPAADALRIGDVLMELDEQILINPDQLQVLVQRRHSGETVTLKYRRGDEMKSARVTLGAHALAQRPAVRSLLVLRPTDGSDRPLSKSESVAIAAEVERLRAELGDRSLPGLTSVDRAPRTPLDSPGAGSVSASPLDGENSRLIYNYAGGSLQIDTRDSKRTIIARSSDGAVIFSGPVDTLAQRQTLPAEVRTRLERFDRDVRPKLRIGKFEKLPAPFPGQLIGSASDVEI